MVLPRVRARGCSIAFGVGGARAGSRAMSGDVTLARGDACALMVRCIGNALFLWVKLVTDGRILGLEL